MMRPWLTLLLCLVVSTTASAFDADFGGQVRFFSSTSFYGSDHIAPLYGPSDPYFDSALDLRLLSSMYLTDQLEVSAHYQAEGSAGDTGKLRQSLPVAYHPFFSVSDDSDDTKLFDLSSDYRSDSGRTFLHRLDRLFLKYRSDLSSLTLGRQAVSLGSGLIFNPMDLVNPFAPSDVIRDYKTGTDMAVLQFSKAWITDCTLVYVPRRNNAGHLDIDDPSLAVKLKTYWDDKEAGLFYAAHYNDHVTGLSLSGFLGTAAWRSDLLWTHTVSQSESGYASAVVNLDYSWVWDRKNWYGFIEFFYSGIGEQGFVQALQKPSLTSRIRRGDLYNTGTRYLGLHLRHEYHPLVNLSCAAILNLDDHSSLLQPTIKWNAAQSLDILFGADLPFGPDNSEFNGITDPFTQKTIGPAQKIYVQATYYF
ncbi:MAG: hypothetical protein K9K87_10990 [Desulfotignum sp.]|nr:hypothetical protein [Desulfotignum sp.]